MSLGIDYPKLGSANPITGQSYYTVIDTYNTAIENNGALQPLGSITFLPLNPASLTTSGIGLQQAYKYVRYNPTVTQTLKNGPALVYWKDETFTTVTPLASEAFSGINNIAGWLLYNTTALSSATAAQINGNFCWICVGGLLAGAWVTAAAAADASIYGASSTAFATGTSASGTAPPQKVAGWSLAAAASNLVDLYVPLLY